MSEPVRMALVPGHGGPPDHGAPGSGVTSRDGAARSRAAAIDWRAVAPYLVEDEERREAAARGEQEPAEPEPEAAT